MPRLRVCCVSHVWAHGGAQLSLIELIDAMTARGVECRVVIPAGGEVPSALAARAIPYLTYHYWPWAWEAPLPRRYRFFNKPVVHLVGAVKLARLVRGWRCDVIVTNTITVSEGALAAKLLRSPHVTHAREFGERQHGLRFEWEPRLSVRLLRMLSTRVVFNSAAMARHYSGQVAAERARGIYNAVSLPPAALAQEVTLEAMELGTSVIGARSGATPELIRDGVHGLLYTPGDPGELADKIELLGRDAHRTRQMGERASRFSRNMFSLDRHGREFLDSLNEIAAERTNRLSGMQLRGTAAAFRARLRTIANRLAARRCCRGSSETASGKSRSSSPRTTG
jgi:glycosyltransferase involved in cell wall biosynthesis